MAIRDEVDSKKKFMLEEQSSPEGQAVVENDVERPTKDTLQSKVQSATATANKGKAKKERFLWIKVWISYLLSLTMKDMGRIPDNIGDKIIITNNAYLTKLYINSIIHIHELGQSTPITLLEVLNGALRDRGNKAILDMTIKNKNYDFDPKNSGLTSRIRMWENNLESDLATKRIKERSARCLYTVRVAQSGKQLKNSRVYLTVRAKDIASLNQAEKIIYEQLGAMGCMYLPVHSDVKSTLEYISLVGNRTSDLKGVAPVMTSNVILSQIAPNCGSYNDRTGYYIGQNVLNGAHYYIDFNDITSARNMYVIAPAGGGKTVLATNMAQSAYENGSACCFMDIKGNEYVNFINATNGYIVSLRPTSIEYINSWVMRKSDTTQEHAEAYFKSRVQFSKQQIIILSGVTDRPTVLALEELLDEFHDALYITLGADPTNMNSWYVTEQLTPYEVFDRFEKYVSSNRLEQYKIHKTVMGTIRMYMSSTGSKSYIFKKEFDYANILNSDTLSFDFGLLSGGATVSDIDEDLFRLKFLYMSKLNSDFTTRKYSEGRRTFKILEESQIVSDEVIKMYVEEYTLRRSQNQDTLLLGNSIQALSHKDLADALIENARGLFIGELTKDARDIVIEQFGIKHLEKFLKIPGSSKRYKNSFVFVNNMQKKALYPIIQVQIENDESGKPRKYKVNTPVKEKNVMSGS